jgi:hypothetical protein
MRRSRFGRQYIFSRLLIALVLAVFAYFMYMQQFGRVYNPFNISFEAFEDIAGD